MAENLMAPSPQEDESLAEAVYGTAFEGFAGDKPGSAAGSGPVGPDVELDDPACQQKQFVKQPAAHGRGQDSTDESRQDEAHRKPPAPGFQRVAVEKVLADARRVAEDSGMLGDGKQQIQNVAAAPAGGGEPVAQDSPFEFYQNQADVQAGSSAPAKTPTPGDTRFPARHPETSGEPVSNIPLAPASAQGEGKSADGGSGMRGPFLARLQQFSERIHTGLGARGMFLIDDEGQVLLDELDDISLIQAARALANAAHRANRQTSGAAAIGNLNIKITANMMLQVIPVASRYGLLILGVMFSAPLSAERVEYLARELHDTVEPDC